MTQIRKEKRLSPRIKYGIALNLPDNISIKTVDISEKGVGFVADKILNKDLDIPACLYLGSDSLKIQLQIIRKNPLGEGKFFYGAKYINLEDSLRQKLRIFLIKTKTTEILDKTDNPSLKNQILNYFLDDIKKYLDELDKIEKEISAGDACDPLIERKLTALNDQIVLKGNSLEEKVNNKEIIKTVKENFRLFTGAFAYKSLIVKRAFEKPRGYPGDYKMIEDVYDNQPYSEGIGRYYDKYFLSNPYAVAVRLRKDRLREMIIEYIAANTSEPSLKILNLACGSCREVAELIPRLKYKNSLIFTCIDWDQEALDFSKGKFQNLAPNIKVELLQKDLFTMIKDKEKAKGFDRQNLIYSIGLIDYLPDRVLKRWLQFFWQLLPQGGKFIVALKNKEKTFPPLPPGWFCDWKFVLRTKNELIDLLSNCGLTDFSLDIKVDEFTYIFYFTLTKN